MGRINVLGRAQILEIILRGKILEEQAPCVRLGRMTNAARLCGYEVILTDEETLVHETTGGGAVSGQRLSDDQLNGQINAREWAPTPTRPAEVDVTAIVAEKKANYHITREKSEPVRVWACRMQTFAPEPDAPPDFSVFSAYEDMADRLTSDQIDAKNPIPPNPQLLISRSVTNPFIKRAIGRKRKGTAVDVGRCVQNISRGRFLRSVPFMQRIGWARTTHVLIDRSSGLSFNWLDQSDMLAYLSAWCGKDLISVFVVADAPTENVFIPAKGNHSQRAQYQPSPGTVVLALSDLGCLRGSEVIQQSWFELGERLDKSGCTPIALLPCPSDRWSPKLARIWHMAAWDRGSRLKPPGFGSNYSPKADTAHLNKRQEIARELLMALSPFLSVQPGLIREIIQTNYSSEEADVGTEYEIWNSPEFDNLSPFGAIFNPQRQKDLREKLKIEYLQSDSIRDHMQGIVKIAARHHYSLSPAVLNLELLFLECIDRKLADEYKKELQTLMGDSAELITDSKRYFKRFVAGMVQQHIQMRNDSIALWSRDLLDRMSGVDSEVMSSIVELTAVAMDCSNKKLTFENIPDGLDLHNYAWLTKPPLKTWRLQQVGEEIRIVPEGTRMPFTIGVVQARLPQVEVEYSTKSLEGPFLRRLPGFSRDAPDTGHLSFPLRNLKSLKTDAGKVEFESFVKPAWADETGFDEYGFYAEFSIKNVVQRLRWIPPGRFMMGSPLSEKDRYGNETLHEVTLTHGYWLGDTACTQELWKAVMGENPSTFKDNLQNPVEKVSWEMIDKEFLPRINGALPGLDLGLPTEAQWEYACRAGSETPFWWGEELTTSRANYDGNYPYAGGAKGEYRGKTLPVKSFERNPFGLWQMHGNVWEWCSDRYIEDLGSAPVVDPIGPLEGARRVLRGGSWYYNLFGRFLRSAYRSRNDPSYAFVGFGFRLARGHSEPRVLQEESSARRSEPAEKPPARRTGGGDRSRSAAAGGRGFLNGLFAPKRKND